MAQCYGCKEELSGQWKLAEGYQDFSKTGRYIGIKNGYFCYQGEPNWVYSYCQGCYKTEIMKLATTYNETEITAQKNQAKEMQQTSETLAQGLYTAQQNLTQLNVEIALGQQQKEQLLAEATGLQLHNARLSEEAGSLQKQIADTNNLMEQTVQLTNETTTLQHQKQQLANDINSLRLQKAQLVVDILNNLEDQVRRDRGEEGKRDRIVLTIKRYRCPHKRDGKPQGARW
jgi:hypothetical protein